MNRKRRAVMRSHRNSVDAKPKKIKILGVSSNQPSTSKNNLHAPGEPQPFSNLPPPQDVISLPWKSPQPSVFNTTLLTNPDPNVGWISLNAVSEPVDVLLDASRVLKNQMKMEKAILRLCAAEIMAAPKYKDKKLVILCTTAIERRRASRLNFEHTKGSRRKLFYCQQV